MDDDQLFSKYDTLILEALEEDHVPGVSIAVVHGDSTWVEVCARPYLLVTTPSRVNSIELWDRPLPGRESHTCDAVQRSKHVQSLRSIQYLVASWWRVLPRCTVDNASLEAAPGWLRACRQPIHGSGDSRRHSVAPERAPWVHSSSLHLIA